MLAKARIRNNCDDIVLRLEELDTIIKQCYFAFQNVDDDVQRQIISRLTSCYESIEVEYSDRTAKDISSIKWSHVFERIRFSSRNASDRAKLRIHLQTHKKKWEVILASIRAEHDSALSEQEVMQKLAERIFLELKAGDSTTLNDLTEIYDQAQPLLSVIRSETDDFFN